MPWAIRHTLILLFALVLLLPASWAERSIKVVNGRVKEIFVKESRLTVTYEHPVTQKQEDLILKVDLGTGFGDRLRLEDFRSGEPISVDYEESPSGEGRAILVKRVPLRGVPKELVR